MSGPQGEGGSQSGIPCVFVPETPVSPRSFPSLLGPKTVRRLESQAALPRPGTNWLDQAQLVRLGLIALLATKETPKGPPEDIARSVAAAVRTCLTHGQLGLANELLEPALKLDPDEPELSVPATNSGAGEPDQTACPGRAARDQDDRLEQRNQGPESTLSY